MASLALPVSAAVVHPWHCDHFGHMNTRHYAALFDDAIFLFWNQMGADAPAQVVPVTAQMTTAFLLEAIAGTCVAIEAQVSRIGSKSAGLRFALKASRTDTVLATCDVVEVFFDTATRSSQPIPANIRHTLEALSTEAAV
ncbi:hypothetical protein F3J45_02815 [Pantoea sp. Ap-967]|uniref:acyl-CoA thioesterase n=1 Tax=Pantoea sp. Ap-967 TaxID=2608362 RepID=UPI00141E9535|nr:thioesterase family protein [Pantoea sp. Ap-967]NIE73397.1 hypothetical protein [Pantoea sp. Ap-967]